MRYVLLDRLFLSDMTLAKLALVPRMASRIGNVNRMLLASENSDVISRWREDGYNARIDSSKSHTS